MKDNKSKIMQTQVLQYLRNDDTISTVHVHVQAGSYNSSKSFNVTLSQQTVHVYMQQIHTLHLIQYTTYMYLQYMYAYLFEAASNPSVAILSYFLYNAI